MKAPQTDTPGHDYRYLRVRANGEYMHITLELPLDFRSGPLGGKRKKKAMAVFRRFFEDLGEPAGRELSKTSRQAVPGASLMKSLSKVDRRISALFDAPVAASTTRSVLGITTSEQIRWMKDGRLRSSSRLRVGGKDTSFSVPVYDADVIAMLEKNPAIIEGWRETDRLQLEAEELFVCD